jgi:short-subunit dehydrogenase
MRLEGKRTLVTGAGSGIGRALAIEASRRGMVVALCGRRADALAETAALLDHAKAHIVAPADVTHAEDRQSLRDRLLESWGGLDVLVNNAGVIEAGRLEQLDDAALEQTFATNVVAPVALTRDMLPLLLAAKPARVVNVGSVFGDIPYPLFGAYSATKFALRGFSIALRRELRDRGVGVTYAAPRATKTEATDSLQELIAAMQPQLDDPSTVAEQIWSGVAKDADSVYPAGPERLFVLLQRLFPSLVDRAVSKQMARLIAGKGPS